MRKESFDIQTETEYISQNVHTNRKKLVEKIEKIENEIKSDFNKQKLELMALKVKKLMHIGDINVVNLYGIMYKYGIFNSKNAEKAEFYLSRENVEVLYPQFGERTYLGQYKNIFRNEYHLSKGEIYDAYSSIIDNEGVSAQIAAIRSKKKITSKDINKLLSIKEMQYKIEVMFTAGLLLRSTDIEKSKNIRNEAMKLYLSTKWSKYSDSLVFFEGIGLNEPIFQYYEEFRSSIRSEVNINDLLKYGSSAYKKINTPWVLNFGEDFDIPEAVTFQLIEREQNKEKISLLYADYIFWSKNKHFQENMFFMFHLAIFLKVHGYDKTTENKEFIAKIFRKCADEKIDPASGYFYYELFDKNYVDIDKADGIEYLKKSVDAGCNEAIYTYAVDLATGNYVVQNDPAAKMYLTQIQNTYQPAKAYLESHLLRNVLDFRIHNDDEINSGSISEMTESLQSKSENESIEMAKDVGKFMMNFKDWIPLIMSIIRVIQACSSSISTPEITPNSTPKEVNESETIQKIRRLFDWATTLIQKIASSLDLYSIKNTEVSVLISILFTFFFAFMIFSLNTNALTSLKFLICCTIFIPFSFGIAAIEKTWGYALFIIGVILIGLSVIVAILIRFRNYCMKAFIQKLMSLNIFV